MSGSATRESQDLAGVTAVLLAGGRGSRLSTVLADRPKVLAHVQGRPFLAYLLDQVAAHGVGEVVISTGYLGGQVKDTFGDSYHGLRLVYSHESSPLGTAGALRRALPLLKSDSVLVMNGDSICKVALKAFWDRHCARGANATLLLAKMSETTRYGRVDVDDEGHVLGFQEKKRVHGGGWVNAGIYLIRRHFIGEIPAQKAVSLEREVFPNWIGNGLYGYKGTGHFLDIGTPAAYARAGQFFLREELV